jgi:hypothetical protein
MTLYVHLQQYMALATADMLPAWFRNMSAL